jgi:RNA polymerase sigma factor (sigma-70 family)
LAAVPSIGRASLVEAPRVAPQAAATQGLYERHAAKIQSYCQHQLGSREEAEDAVQTTFMNAFRALGRGVVPEAESAWLFKIAENVCLSRRRSTWRRGRIESPSDFDVIEEIVPGPNRQRDELIGIEDALASMPEQQRRAILLREWQGLSYREIAAELEVSQSAVETLIFRARRSLAQGLEQPDTIKPKRKSFRRAMHMIDLGTIAAALKTLLAGSAAVKATAAAVAVTAAAGTAATVGPKFGRSAPPSPAPITAVAPPTTGQSSGPSATSSSTSGSSGSSVSSLSFTSGAAAESSAKSLSGAAAARAAEQQSLRGSVKRSAPGTVGTVATPATKVPTAPVTPVVVEVEPATPPVVEQPAAQPEPTPAPAAEEPKHEPKHGAPPVANPGKGADEGKKDEGKKDEAKKNNGKQKGRGADVQPAPAAAEPAATPAPAPASVTAPATPAAEQAKDAAKDAKAAKKEGKRGKDSRELAVAPAASPATTPVVTETTEQAAAPAPDPVVQAAAPVAEPQPAPAAESNDKGSSDKGNGKRKGK